VVGLSVICAVSQALQLITKDQGAFTLSQLVLFGAAAAVGIPTFISKPKGMWPNRARYLWHACGSVMIVMAAQLVSAKNLHAHAVLLSSV
jgi:hypothetical protein